MMTVAVILVAGELTLPLALIIQSMRIRRVKTKKTVKKQRKLQLEKKLVAVATVALADTVCFETDSCINDNS